MSADGYSMNLAEFTPVVNRFLGGAAAAAKVFTSPLFVRKVQVYIVSQVDKTIKEIGGLKEGQSAVVRGETIKGWSSKGVKTYGVVNQQGTRYYYRKFARSEDGLKKKGGATLSKGQRGKAWAKDIPVRQRPFEKVWNKRASGRRYSESSKIMADTGKLRQAVIAVRVQSDGRKITLRPGTGVSYFDAQNSLRRVWVVFPPKDGPVIAKYAEEEMAKQFADGGASGVLR